VNELVAGYIFISERSQGEAVVMPDAQAELHEILSKLASLLDQGSFVHSDKENDCHFCEYATLCVFSDEVTTQARRKLACGENETLDAFRRLRHE
jgi:hypothetical protein